MHFEAECWFLLIQMPVTKSVQKTASMSTMWKNITTALKNKEAVSHMYKRRHICWHLNTVTIHWAGNTSSRLHGLEMRNMIHFLSMLESHVLNRVKIQWLNQTWKEILRNLKMNEVPLYFARVTYIVNSVIILGFQKNALLVMFACSCPSACIKLDCCQSLMFISWQTLPRLKLHRFSYHLRKSQHRQCMSSHARSWGFVHIEHTWTQNSQTSRDLIKLYKKRSPGQRITWNVINIWRSALEMFYQSMEEMGSVPPLVVFLLCVPSKAEISDLCQESEDTTSIKKLMFPAKLSEAETRKRSPGRVANGVHSPLFLALNTRLFLHVFVTGFFPSVKTNYVVIASAPIWTER